MNPYTDHTKHGAALHVHEAGEKTPTMEHEEHADIKDQQALAYNLNLQTDPAKPAANTATQLAIIVTEQAVGEPVTTFEPVHDKLMHLIIVSEDLTYFDHLHLDHQNGIFSVNHTFPHTGNYKLWADVKPKGSKQLVTAFRLRVSGQPVYQPKPLMLDRDLVKTVMNDQYRVQLELPADLAANRHMSLKFAIADANGKPLTDLQAMLGAKAHCIIISQDTRDFLHVHPEGKVHASWRGGPDATFHAQFPKPGLYKTWVQFQHHGKTITAAFIIVAK